MGFDRDDAISWYRRNRARSQALFDLLTDDAYYSQPIALRHPIVFYAGHLPAFSFNTLVKRGLGDGSIDERLETLFARGIDPDTEGRDLARYLVDELHARLSALAAARPRFHLVDMRAALPADNTHWADEIHPSGTGFRKLAEDHWRPLLRAQFPGRGFE